MEILTIQFLESWLKDCWNIIIDLHICLNNAKRYTKSIYEYEDNIKRMGFIEHHRYQLNFIMIIQLCKLLDENKNQKRNFYKLCN
ncbi:MAG: hypothetical protein ACHQHP_05615, partial [Bacteroidia bacterium]